MKAFTQIVVPIVIVVGLVAGLTFVTQYSSVAPPITPGEGTTRPDPASATLLRFPVKVVEWTPPTAGEREALVPGYHDYWFENPMPVAVKVGVNVKNCKCAKVELCTFTQEKGEIFQRLRVVEPVALLLASRLGMPALLSQAMIQDHVVQLLKVKPKWDVLLLDAEHSKGLLVPAQAAGMIRLSYEPKNPGAERLTAELWMQTDQSPPSPLITERLELPVTFVPPVGVQPQEGSVGDLLPNSKARTSFRCWSSTRAAFSVTPQVLTKEGKPDPCFVCTSTPLTLEECVALSKEVNTRVLCGYRVTVTVQERVSESVQMDLGPFRRRLELVTDLRAEPVPAVVLGTVRGEVMVGTAEDNDRIALGHFLAAVGKVRTLQITTNQPQLELLTDSIEVEPEYLKVELKKVSAPAAGVRAQWSLQVQVPPGHAYGVLPSQSAIYLKIQGTPPRRIRIPVSGNAYQR